MFGTGQALAIGGPKPAARAKYTARGWVFNDDQSIPHDLKGIFFPDRVRRVLDSKTWVITFDTTNLPVRKATTLRTRAITWDPSLPNSWVLPQTIADGADHRKMHFAVFSSATLQGKYLIANERLLYRISATFKNFDKEEEARYSLSSVDNEGKCWKFRDFDYPCCIEEYELVAQN